MDDLIKVIQELMSKKPTPKGGIADTAAGVEFIGKRLSKEQIGDFTIIGSKLTDASRFEPFNIANIGKNKRYTYMKEYSEDLQNNFEKTLSFIKDNPDIRLTQGQKDNIIYNLGVLRRTKAEKDKLEKSIYGEGKKSENIFDMEGKALDEKKPIIGGKGLDETPAKAGEVLDLPQWAQKSLDRLNELKKYYSKNPPNNKDTLDLYNKQIVQREKALRYTLESGGDETMFEKLRTGPKTKIPEVFETNKYIDLLPTDQEKTMRNVNRQFGFDFVEDTPVSKKPAKAGEGKFTKAQVLVERLKNTIKENPNDEYVQQNFPNFIKEIEAKPELADDANVQEAFGLTDLSETTDQRLVEYPDGTLDFYTKGNQGGMESVQSLIDELGISQDEALRIKQLEPEDQILEITRLRTLKNKPEKAQGGLIGLHI